MRIVEIQLIAFGPFTDHVIDLSQKPSALHIVYGPNEAGKSAALRGLTALFYGIPMRTPDNFLHENPNLRLGARLQHSDGDELFFVRRKGSKDTLLDQEGRPLPESRLAKYLGGANEALFASMFGLDHEMLIRGGEQILKGGGVIGESLFAAGFGGSNLRDVLRGLDEEAAKLFLPRGKAQLISSAINAYREARQVSVQSSLASREWAEHDAALREATTEKGKIDAELRRLESEKNRLLRLAGALPRVAERKQVLARLDALGKIRIVSPDFGKKRFEAVRQLTVTEDTGRLAREALERIQQRMEAFTLPESLLQQAETISGLHERLGSYRKSFKDLPRLQGERVELAADAEAILKELRPGINLEGAETLRVTAAKRARIRELGNRRQALEDHFARMGREAHKLELKLAARKERQAKLAVPHDPDALRLAISSAQKQGELEQELGTAVSELQALKEQTAIELQRLGLWSGALKELESLSMPSAETIDRFETASDGLERRLESLLEALGKAEQAGQELDLQVSELRMTGAVPSEADLENARSRREQGWMLVRRAWVDGVEEPEEWRGFDPANPLATAYEVSVMQADMVADRLRREADRVARQAALLAQREKVGAEREACRMETGAIQQKIQALDHDWRQLWQPLGISPLKPREMRAWVVKQDRLVQSAARLRAEEQRVAMLKERIEAHRSTLSRRLEQLGEQQASAGETLESLIHRSQKVILDMEELAGKHREMQQALQQLEEDLAAVLREKEDAVNNLARWQGEWERAVTVLGLAGSASASEANLVLDKVEDLFRKIDKLAGLDGRIAGILKDGKEFERDVELLARRLAPELDGEPAGQVVQDLNGRLHKALEDSATLGELNGQRAEKEELIRQCQVTLQTAQRQLRELCLEAECSRHEELEAIEERSGQARELLDQVAMLEKQLLDYCAGGSLETLIQEVEAVDADSLDFQIKSAEERLEDLGGKRSELLETMGREKTRLALMDGSGRAAEAAEAAQQSLAEIRAHTDRYLQLRLASAILRREIERYRMENQAPLLKRSSELFSRLTMGSFAALQTDYNEADEPVLLGVRPRGEKVPVTGMSEGTRDQLHLALRLASLEKYLQHNEPMPLIVDDILINFDDDRAEATLKVLEDLAGTTQVIFFTHHKHLLELAERAVSSDILKVNNLLPNSMLAEDRLE